MLVMSLGCLIVVELIVILFVFVSSSVWVLFVLCILLLIVSGMKYIVVVWCIMLRMVLWFL